MSSAGIEFVNRLKKLQSKMIVDEGMLASLVDLEIAKSKASVIRDFSKKHPSEEASKFADSLDEFAKAYKNNMEIN